MLRHHYDHRGSTLLRTETAEPVCGEDFCDTCGDCLHCYGDDPCMPSEGVHFWVVYEPADSPPDSANPTPGRGQGEQ